MRGAPQPPPPCARTLAGAPAPTARTQLFLLQETVRFPGLRREPGGGGEGEGYRRGWEPGGLFAVGSSLFYLYFSSLAMQPSSPRPSPAPRRLPIASLGEGGKAGGGGGTCLRLSMSTSATQNMASAFDRALRRGEQGILSAQSLTRSRELPGRGGRAAPGRGRGPAPPPRVAPRPRPHLAAVSSGLILDYFFFPLLPSLPSLAAPFPLVTPWSWRGARCR